MPSTNSVDAGNTVNFMISVKVFVLIFTICELGIVNYEVNCVLKMCTVNDEHCTL